MYELFFIMSTFTTINVPPGYEHLKLYSTDQQVTQIKLASEAAESLLSVLKELKRARLAYHIKSYWGCINERDIVGRIGIPSQHTYGLACDFNADEYPLGSEKRFPQEVVDIFRKHDWFYGGDFKNRKDPHHFEYRKKSLSFLSRYVN